MNPPRIENSDRGFTVNKPAGLIALAAFLLSGALAFNAGSQRFARMEQSIVHLTEALEAQATDRQQYRRDIEGRLRSLENDRTGDRRDLSNALNLLTRIDARLERIERQYRGQQ